jgi:ribosome-associated protein
MIANALRVLACGAGNLSHTTISPMSRFDRARPAIRRTSDAAPNSLAAPTDKPSKTRRKAHMHALQDLGVALVELDAARFEQLGTELELPERLVDAIVEARCVTAWGARKRALQYVGRLMRDVDPDPIRAQLERWAHGHDVDAAHQRKLERWRERLLADPNAVDALAAECPGLDRAALRSLVARARDERSHAAPPHAYREIFRTLKLLLPGESR